MKRTLLTLAVTSLLVTTAFAGPIHDAAWDGDLAGVQAELDKGADINAKDEFGYTLLYLAASRGHKEIVKLLIAAGADVNAKSEDGWTPLHNATGQGYKEIVELLIAKGADVNAKDDDIGWTPLHLAARYGHKEIAELLIANGAEVNAKDEDGRTPLLLAIINSHKGKTSMVTTIYVDIVELLIAEGADVNAKDNQGRTPVDRTVRYSETADLLRKHGGKTGEELKAEGK